MQSPLKDFVGFLFSDFRYNYCSTDFWRLLNISSCYLGMALWNIFLIVIGMHVEVLPFAHWLAMSYQSSLFSRQFSLLLVAFCNFLLWLLLVM